MNSSETPGDPEECWRHRMTRLLLLVALALVSFGQALIAQPSPLAATPLAAFDSAWALVNEHFFDPDFRGVDWPALRSRSRPIAAAASSVDEVAQVINGMLAELETSHTHLYHRSDPEYYRLMDIFNGGAFAEGVRRVFPSGVVTYPSIGVLVKQIDDEFFVAGILQGSPAGDVDLAVGDRIVSVNGAEFRPIESFVASGGQPVTLRIQRSVSPNDSRDLSIVPVMTNPGDEFLEAMRSSITIFEREGAKIGYVHVWSYAGEQYQELLESEVAFGALADADGLVLDIRDGLGGANPSYLNLFNRSVPRLTPVTRDGPQREIDFQWRKPVVLLVNGGSRSGKEILAFGFRKYGIGTVVGTRTAGAVVGGRVFMLPGDLLLYLAVQDALVDGERLEGKGVTPDIIVPFNLPYARGADPQLERAIAEVVDQLKEGTRR